MVTSTSSKVQYTANGVTTAFAFDFPFLAKSHITVLVTTRRRG